MSDDRTVLITGATDGLGRALADHLAAGVPDLVDRLDVLVDNAGLGAGATPERRVTTDGHELIFAVNYLATFDLTQRLLPFLRASGGARIVLVASLGQQPIDFDDVMLERGYSGGRAYSQSKLAQITYGFTLATRVPPDEVTVNSLHPATYMPTKMVLEAGVPSIDSLERGQAATYRLVVDSALAGLSGRFFDRERESQADDSAYDAHVQRRLWELSLRLTGAPDVAG